MPSFTISDVDFITVHSSDLEASAEFYAGVLGLERTSTWGSGERPTVGIEFVAGDVTIALVDSAKLGMPTEPCRHPIALRVDDVAAARAELEAAGVEFLHDTIDSGVCHMAHFADPDGNVLMFHHRYAPPVTRT